MAELRDSRFESSCGERFIDFESFNGIVDVEGCKDDVFMRL